MEPVLNPGSTVHGADPPSQSGPGYTVVDSLDSSRVLGSTLAESTSSRGSGRVIPVFPGRVKA